MFHNLSLGESFTIACLPGTGKSIVFSRLFPFWLENKYPHQFRTLVVDGACTGLKGILASFYQNLSSKKNLIIIDSLTSSLVSKSDIWSDFLAHKSLTRNLSALFLTSDYLSIENIHPVSYQVFQNCLIFSNQDSTIIKTLKSINLIKNPGDDLLSEITQNCFGNLKISKVIYKLIAGGESIDNVVDKPTQFPPLSAVLADVFAHLGNNVSILTQLAKNNTPANIPETVLKYFKETRLIDQNLSLTSSLVKNYLLCRPQPVLPDVVGVFRFNSPLTKNESKAVAILQENPGKILSRQDLMIAVWGPTKYYELYDHSLDQLVSRLRKKFASASPPATLITLKGRGYSLENPQNTSS